MKSSPALDFINWVTKVEVPDYNINEPYIPINVSLQWGNGEYWTGELKTSN